MSVASARCGAQARTSSRTSDLVIIDATDFTAAPVATVSLTRRIPFGFQGRWYPASADRRFWAWLRLVLAWLRPEKHDGTTPVRPEPTPGRSPGPATEPTIAFA